MGGRDLVLDFSLYFDQMINLGWKNISAAC